MRYFIGILCVLIPLASLAQLDKAASNWHFGKGASVNFISSIPAAGTSAISTTEGCASISDPNTGQLLFYTNGDTVWDRTNGPMPNGTGLIGGGGTSTQAALIIPKPSNTKLYYLFTADQGGYISPNQGIHYSMVDMSLNGGLGDVSTKNQLLTAPPTTEKLTAVGHCNGKDYWIITHPFNSNDFYAYLLSSAGLNPAPIISSAGTVHADSSSGSHSETIGYLKSSMDGKKLALAIYYHIPIAEIFDFDNSTGIVSNPIAIHYPGPLGAYGISFSPDNSKLYVTTTGGDLYQYDLSSGIPSNILSSQTLIASSPQLGALQLASDGKIYVATDQPYLSAINSPNNSGSSCNFQNAAINLTSGTCFEGLPNFVDCFNYVSTPNTCVNNIQENNLSHVTISPNPTTGRFQIKGNSFKYSVCVFNSYGELVLSKCFDYSTEVNLPEKEHGMFFVKISWGTFTEVLKLVKYE